MEQIAKTMVNVVRLIVDNPADVAMEIFPEKNTVQMRLTVAPDDTGKVIGRNGRTARSLRTLIEAMGRTKDRTIDLEIMH